MFDTDYMKAAKAVAMISILVSILTLIVYIVSNFGDECFVTTTHIIKSLLIGFTSVLTFVVVHKFLHDEDKVY